MKTIITLTVGILIGMALATANEFYRFTTVSLRDGKRGIAVVERDLFIEAARR